MTPKKWLNLALAATLAFYIVQISYLLINFNMCGNFGMDFCAFWSAGRISHEHGLAGIYDMDLLTQYQKDIYPQGNHPFFQTFAVMYPPVFVLPFILLSLIRLPVSYLIWTLINLIGLIFYLRFFVRWATEKTAPSSRLIFIAIIALPVFINLHEGQVNFWLAICIGEFMRAIFSEKPTKAGLWLGGWLIKPQLLILILPFLLIQRSFNVFKGFMIATVAILGVSLALIRVDGVLALAKLFLEAGGGNLTSNPAAMMNLRMLGWHVASLTTSTAGWVMIIIGSTLTAGTALWIFRYRIHEDSDMSAIALLGLLAATNAVTWHAHLHMAVTLIPPMLYLLVNKRFPKKLFALWVFVPVLIRLFSYLFMAIIHLGDLPINIALMSRFLGGFTGLSINLILLGWAVFEYTRLRKKASEANDLMENGVI